MQCACLTLLLSLSSSSSVVFDEHQQTTVFTKTRVFYFVCTYLFLVFSAFNFYNNFTEMSAFEILTKAIEFDVSGRHMEALKLYQSGITEVLKKCKGSFDYCATRALSCFNNNNNK